MKPKVIKMKKDIRYLAKLAGVSVSTASRAINNSPGASKETIEKINKLAKKIGYLPNSVAKSLRSKKTNTIGVILNDIQNPFFSDILWAINEKLADSNYNTIISYSNWDLELERKNILNLLSLKVDGIIINPIDEKGENINLVLESGIETVFLDSYSIYDSISHTYCDHKRAAFLGADYLLQCGHKDILLISAIPSSSIFSRLYIDGYKQALRNYKIRFKKDLILQLNDATAENLIKIFKETITNNEKIFTSILINSDYLAMFVYIAIRELGLNIPKDLSIVGYDDITICSALSPPLTTIRQERKQIGYTSVRILLDNIKPRKRKIVEKVIIQPQLIIRESVRKIL